MMKYDVSLSDKDRNTLGNFIKASKDSPQKRYAGILLELDGQLNKPADVARHFECSRATVHTVAERFCRGGIGAILKERPKGKGGIFTDEALERLFELHESPPPQGFNRWTIPLLAEKAIELGLADKINHKTL